MSASPALRPGAPRDRRVAAVLVVSVLGAAVLTACSASSVTADGQFPVTVTHRFGETVVAAAPRRVAALGLYDQDVLLALGIVPAGAAVVGPELAPWTARRLAEVRRRTGGPPVPVQTQLQPSGPDVLPTAPPPDLILATTKVLGQQDYDDDGAVAPVVGPPPGYGESRYPIADDDESQAPWQDSTRLVGHAVGEPAEADRLIADLEGRFAAARTRYPQLQGRTAACVRWGVSRSEEAFAYPAGPRTPCSRFLAALGMRGVPALDRTTGGSAQIVSAPLVAAARPDLIVLDEGGPERRDIITRYRLPAGQPVATLDDTELPAVDAGNVLSLPVALVTVPARLARAVR